MAKKVFVYHEEITDFLKSEFAKLPEQEANYIAAELTAFIAHFMAGADWQGLFMRLSPCQMIPTLYYKAPGRPNKENAPAPTLAQLITEPERRARIEAILRSGAIKKPANVAHLARAIERLKWTRWQEGSPKDFYMIAANLIGTRAGGYDGFNSALQRARSDKQKSNENYTTAKAVQRFIKLLQADEI